MRQWAKTISLGSCQRDALSLNCEDDFFICCSCLKNDAQACWTFSIWCNDHNMNKSACTIRGKTIVCDYCLHHCRNSFSLSVLALQGLGGLCSTESSDEHLESKLFGTESQNHTFTERLMLGGISGDHLGWPLCSEQRHRSLSRTVSTLVLSISKDGVSIAFLGNKSEHWILLRRSWLHLLHLPSQR